MNILYIAYSCDPYQGSEDKIGWCVPAESAKTNRVYVITKEEHRASINRYLAENKIENIEFHFVDIPAFYKRIFNGFLYSGRLNIWNRRAFSVAKKICKEKNIEIIHQITPIEFRAIGDYGKIKNVKFVCGPLGGAEPVPGGLKDYIRGYELVEIMRALINCWCRFWLKMTGKLAHCDYVMFANRETRDYLMKDGRADCMDAVVTEIAINIPPRESCAEDSRTDKKCTFLVAGRMIYRKGHELLLDTLTEIPDKLPYECRIVGGGPELEKLQHRCSGDAKLANHVVFTGAIPFREMENEYRKADVLIMPSIRETTGSVLLEAMSRGIPVITVNHFGGSAVLTNESGWLYDGENRESYIENLKDSIIDCVRNPEEVKRRGDNARKKAESYTWDKKNQYYQEIYWLLLEQ